MIIIEIRKKEATYQSSSAWNIDMCAIPPVIPWHRLCKVPRVIVNPVEPSVLLAITVENNLVGARNIDTNPVISEALRMMEVEDEHHAGPFKDNNLVSLVL